MTNSTVVKLQQLGFVDDPLTDLWHGLIDCDNSVISYKDIYGHSCAVKVFWAKNTKHLYL